MAKGDKARSGRSKSGKAAAEARREHWKQEPDEHDYPAAHDYLSLVLGETDTRHVVEALQSAEITHRKAKDLLRASRLTLLGRDDPEVKKDIAKVLRGERLSPVLLVRGVLASDVAMTVADGYHRTCASYHLDEDSHIPCRIVDPPKGRSSTIQRRDGARPGSRPMQVASGRSGGRSGTR